MRKAIFLSILALLIGVIFYMYWFYYNPVSIGTRAGLLQKFSSKGSLFKTYEGEMVMVGFGPRAGNMNANYFYFSVADDHIADSLEHHCQGKIVQVHYTQYRRTLPWRGENNSAKNQEPGQYVVDAIEQVRESSGY